MEIAKIPKRLVAAAIDLIIVFALMYAAIFGINRFYPIKNFSNIPIIELYKTRATWIGLITDFAYTVFWLSSSMQATLGMKAMRIRIIRESGKSVGIGISVLRYILSIFSSLFLKLGYVYALLNKRRQSVHDYIARTVVIEWDSNHQLLAQAPQRVENSALSSSDEAVLMDFAVLLVFAALLFLLFFVTIANPG